MSEHVQYCICARPENIEMQNSTSYYPSHGSKKIRIAWTIGPIKGNGLWLPNTEWEALEEVVADMNVRYGAGTHWIEVIRA